MSDVTTQAIIQALQDVSDSDITEDSDIFELGMDSLSITKCRAILKRSTGRKIPAHFFFDGRTPRGIFELLEDDDA